MAKGCSCDEPELIPVIDRNMAPVYMSGNPYSRYCMNCGRRYFCRKTFWQEADERYVIPNGEDEPIPFEEYEDENAFECPKCDHPQFGQPEECEACEQEFIWK